MRSGGISLLTDSGPEGVGLDVYALSCSVFSFKHRWGVTPPISQYCRLGDLIDAEQAAGLCEALTGLDGADVRIA